MIVQVLVHDICTPEELHNLKRESADMIDYDATILSDGNYDVFARMTFHRCGFVKLMLLKNYARKKKGKVEVKVINEKKKR